jgi:hypothetical protein
MFGLIDDVVKWLALGTKGRILVHEFIAERDHAVVHDRLGIADYPLHDVMASLRSKYISLGLSSEQIVQAELDYPATRIE